MVYALIVAAVICIVYGLGFVYVTLTCVAEFPGEKLGPRFLISAVFGLIWPWVFWNWLTNGRR